jgi:peptide/nickel transport system substrate-binding protein
VGTGPFVFKEWVRGSHIIFDRNPDYWDAPRPYVDRVIFQIITDSSARAAAIESGEINLAPNTPVPLSDIERFSKIESLVLETKGYNYTGSVFRIEFNLDNPNLAQKPVRQALAHAIDRDVLLNVAWYGHAKPTNGPVSPALTKYFIADLPLYAFDPVKAEQLLDEAGLKRGADGNRFSVSVSYIPGDGYKRSTEYLQQAFAAIGVKVDVVSQDFATYVKRVYTDRQFDISVHAMSGYYDPTPGAQRLYISTGFKPGVPFSNGSHYANARVDELLEASAVENDDKKRYEQFAEFQRIIVDDIPALTLLVPQSITIAHKSVRDHSVGADGVAGNLAFAYIQQA